MNIDFIFLGNFSRKKEDYELEFPEIYFSSKITTKSNLYAEHACNHLFTMRSKTLISNVQQGICQLSESGVASHQILLKVGGQEPKIHGKYK